jgi:cyanophycin synthetase
MLASFVNRLTVEGLYFLALGRGFLRYRNPRRRRANGDRKAFNEQAWREAAVALGASWQPLGSGIAQITRNGARTRVVDNMCALDDPVTLAVLHDKPLTHRILAAQGLSVPRHCCFSLRDMAPARSFLKSMARRCVVKPAVGTGGGAGVATGIVTDWQLARAAAAAAIYSDELMIEEQIDGENYRLLYLDGELIDAYARRRPAVVADGRSTVAALVHGANQERLVSGTGVSQSQLTVDMDMRRTLAAQGLSLGSVPPKGSRVTLKTAVNENCGQDNSTVLDRLCRSVVEDGSRAVGALGARWAGIDLVTRDPGVPLAEAGGVILEVNGTPNLYFHYHKEDGCFPSAFHALRRLLGADDVPDPAPVGRGSAAPQPEPSNV